MQTNTASCCSYLVANQLQTTYRTYYVADDRQQQGLLSWSNASMAVVVVCSILPSGPTYAVAERHKKTRLGSRSSPCPWEQTQEAPDFVHAAAAAALQTSCMQCTCQCTGQAAGLVFEAQLNGCTSDACSFGSPGPFCDETTASTTGLCTTCSPQIGQGVNSDVGYCRGNAVLCYKVGLAYMLLCSDVKVQHTCWFLTLGHQIALQCIASALQRIPVSALHRSVLHVLPQCSVLHVLPKCSVLHVLPQCSVLHVLPQCSVLHVFGQDWACQRGPCYAHVCVRPQPQTGGTSAA